MSYQIHIREKTSEYAKCLLYMNILPDSCLQEYFADMWRAAYYT
jgi:hypothetical protein